MEKWTMPKNYFGETWDDYFIAPCSMTRDSDCLEQSNFDECLRLLGGETGEDDNGISNVTVVAENHFLVGWVKWIAIHKDNSGALKIAENIEEQLENYPVLDEDDLSRREMELANEIWKHCYNWQDRIEYIREHRTQFEFNNMANMFTCVRGECFYGYASELIN